MIYKYADVPMRAKYLKFNSCILFSAFGSECLEFLDSDVYSYGIAVLV